MTSSDPVSRSTLLRRALARVCPACGQSPLFASWCSLYDHCSKCRYKHESNDGDTFGFMYISTVVFTGLFFGMMWFIWQPTDWIMRTVLFAVALASMLGSMPYRKSMAVALDYMIRRRFEPITEDGEPESSESNPPPC